ncbi:MAG TPA: PAS domain S-box protein [Terriglobales bacterium]
MSSPPKLSPGPDLGDFTSSTVPMWIFDRATLAVLDVNEAAIQQYGYTRAEFLKLTIVDIRPLDDIPRLLRSAFRWNTMRKNGGLWRHRTKDGAVFQVKVVSRDIQFQNRDAEFVSAEKVQSASHK